MKQLPAALLTTAAAIAFALSGPLPLNPVPGSLTATPDSPDTRHSASAGPAGGPVSGPAEDSPSEGAADTSDTPDTGDTSGPSGASDTSDASDASATTRATSPTSSAAPAALPDGSCALSGSAEGASETARTPGGYARAHGRIRALTVLIDFPDARARISPRARYGEFFPAVPDFYRTSSYGRLDYRSTPVLKWIRMSRSLPSYGIRRGSSFRGAPASRSGWGGYPALSKEIVRAVDRTVDFRKYDLVNVLITPNAGPPATRTVLSVTFSGGDLGLRTNDGAPLRNVSFIWSRQTGTSAFRVLNHENAHSFGLPDLYFTDGRENPHPVGHWDPMDVDWGPDNDFLGWHKWKLGWLAPGQVHCVDRPGSVTEHRLTPTSIRGGTKIAVIPVSRSSAYVVEARARGPLDPTVCRPGVLVYRVSADVPSGRGPMRVMDATPRSDGCFRNHPDVIPGLTDAPYRPGQTYTDSRTGTSITVLDKAADGTYRVRVKAPTA